MSNQTQFQRMAREIMKTLVTQAMEDLADGRRAGVRIPL